MNEIFSISPFVRSNSLPETLSMESIILSNFYLFNGYDKNPYIVRDYMNFIDSEFDFAFSKMKLSIVSYKYPNNIEYGSWQMVDYINDNYNLISNHRIEREYRLDSMQFKHPITGKQSIVRFNEYAMYDIGLLNKSIFNDEDNFDVKMLRFISKYFVDRKDKKRLNDVLDLVEYNNNIIGEICESRNTQLHEVGFICEPLLILCQLKSYIKYLYEERRNI